MKNSYLILIIVGSLFIGGLFIYYMNVSKPKNSDVMSAQIDTTKKVNSDSKIDKKEPAQPTTSFTPSEESTGSNISDMQEIDLISKNFSFEPKDITVKAGKVKFNVKENTGFHDIVIDELNLRETLTTGKSFIWDLTKPGTYEFYCSVGSHRQMGMWGTLIVE